MADSDLPKPVTDQITKTAGDFLDHPEQLGVAGAVGSAQVPSGPGDAARPTSTHAPKLTAAPDLDPNLSGPSPGVDGSNAGGHVRVVGTGHGFSYTTNVKAMVGLDANGKPVEKTSTDVTFTITGGGRNTGLPHYSVSTTGSVGQSADFGNTGTTKTENIRQGVHGEVDLGGGYKVTGDAFGSFDASKGPSGSTGRANFGGSVGVTGPLPGQAAAPAGTPLRTPSMEDTWNDRVTAGLTPAPADPDFHAPMMPGAVPLPKIGPIPTLDSIEGIKPSDKLPPGDALAAKIVQDQFLSQNAATPGERKLASQRAIAEENVLNAHPEWPIGTFQQTVTGLTPGDYRVQMDGKEFTGGQLRLSDTVQDLVRAEMNTQTRSAVQDRSADGALTPDRTPSPAPAGPGR